MILAIDTSTAQGSVALADAGDTLAEISWTMDGNHSCRLGRLMREVLGLQAISVGDLTAMVVATGPGSFSGTRVGISAGKGMAMSLGIPLVGVSTLDVIGFQGCHVSRRVRALLPAGRQQVYSGVYEGTPSRFARVGALSLSSLEEEVERAGVDELLAGEGARDVAAALGSHAGILIREPKTMRLRRAAFLAELGMRHLEAGGSDQLETLEPIYLRKSAAEEKRGL
ncbi:MAG: tRNA (adenosine(37)-N6)-threonylcarbamoyltransferase complex dimerization subunit type 1 TsaB [Chloroflexota bacterium]|nr:MAG: tRNA (adenosine(37)-N6)-threonylcarbamoyltransferase complex dimerization subunit type 1 TsaB [Chloroflexota bacterium]